jgi:plastocyanin
MRRLIAIIGLSTLLAAGCGGGGDDEEQPADSVTVEGGKALRVVGKEYSFDPEGVVVTGGGGKVKITLDNQGSLAHNLKIEQGDRDLGGTPTFQGGEVRSGTVNLKPGSYTMICTVGNHADLGMTGKLEVR